jgi:hypothetical protein
VFDNLGELSSLTLSHNRGIILSDNTFGPSLLNLERLHLDGCGLTGLPDKLFSNLL